MNPRPGEVWLVDLGLAAKTRPVVVVSRFDPDPPRSLIVYVPLTTQHRGSLYEVVLPKLRFLNHTSNAGQHLSWEDPKVREDMLKVYNLRLPEPYSLKLKYIAEQTPGSRHQFCIDALLPVIDKKIKELTGR